MSIKVLLLRDLVMVSVRVHVRDSTCLKGFSKAALDPVLGRVVIAKVSGP